MRELVASTKCKLQGNAKSLDSHDGYRANGRADGDVNERVLAAIFWRNPVNHEDGEYADNDAVDQKAWEICYQHTGYARRESSKFTWLDGIVQNLINRLNVLVWRRMQDDDDGAYQTSGAANLAQRP